MKNEKAQLKFLNSRVDKIIPIRGDKPEGMQFGVELELEGKNVAMGGKAVKGWRQEADGSLRGESIEWVFAKPCEYKEAVERVNRLFKQFKENKVVFNNSYRTSTHVHLNFCDKKIRDVVNFFCVFTVLEELLEIYCGEGREGNLFCLPSRDVEGVVKMLEEALLNYQNLGQFNNEIRYCAANLCSLNKFGTVEIRTLRGADNGDMVLEWMEILRQIYVFAAEKMESPARFIESLSFLGIDGFLSQIFDQKTTTNLLNAWGKRDIRASLFEGVRLIQVMAYRIDDLYAQPWVDPVVPPAKPKKRVWMDAFDQMPDGNFMHRISGIIANVGQIIEWQDRERNFPGDELDELAVEARPPQPPVGHRQTVVWWRDRNRWLVVPNDPRHEQECPGVRQVWYDDNEGLWFDDDSGEYLEFG